LTADLRAARDLFALFSPSIAMIELVPRRVTTKHSFQDDGHLIRPQV
jgi:hypothetical protein